MGGGEWRRGLCGGRSSAVYLGSEDPRMRLLSDLPAVCVQASPLCANLALKHYLLKPVQRIPQYQLLLTGTTTERGTKRLTSCPV